MLDNIEHAFIKETKYHYFYIYFLVCTNFIEISFLIFVYKYQKTVLRNKEIHLFIYILVLILSLVCTLVILLFCMIIASVYAIIYGYIINEAFVTLIGIAYMSLLLVILIYQSVYLFRVIDRNLNRMVLKYKQEVNKFFDIGLKSLTLISVVISMSEYLFSSLKSSFQKTSEVPDFILFITNNLKSFEIMSWGATINFLFIELFLINRRYFIKAIKKVMNY